MRQEPDLSTNNSTMADDDFDIYGDDEGYNQASANEVGWMVLLEWRCTILMSSLGFFPSSANQDRTV